MSLNLRLFIKTPFYKVIRILKLRLMSIKYKFKSKIIFFLINFINLLWFNWKNKIFFRSQTQKGEFFEHKITFKIITFKELGKIIF